MGEIICFGVGGCGIKLGRQYWGNLLDEHGLDLSGRNVGNSFFQKEQVDVCFKELRGENYRPRGIFADLDKNEISCLQSGPSGKLFPLAVSGESSSHGIWPRGHYTYGAEIIDKILDITRKEGEACELLQGFQLILGADGGTGGGLGSLILAKLREEYPDRQFQVFALFPEPDSPSVMVNPIKLIY